MGHSDGRWKTILTKADILGKDLVDMKMTDLYSKLAQIFENLHFGDGTRYHEKYGIDPMEELDTIGSWTVPSRIALWDEFDEVFK